VTVLQCSTVFCLCKLRQDHSIRNSFYSELSSLVTFSILLQINEFLYLYIYIYIYIYRERERERERERVTQDNYLDNLY